MEPTQTELNEALERPDVIWLSLDAGKAELSETRIYDWDEMDAINGDFGNLKSIVVTGIPLYRDAEDACHNATMYVFNQIEILEKIKENKKIKQEMS